MTTTRMWMTGLRRAAFVPLLALAACGGGGSPDGATEAARPAQALAVPPPSAPVAAAAVDPAQPEPPIANPTGRGALKAATLAGRYTAAEITQALQGANYRAPRLAPQYAVTAYRLSYETIDGNGLPIVASGLVVVPDKPAGRLSPVVSYQHGTAFHDVEAPSNAVFPAEPPIVFASAGVILVAPDYVGYGVSNGAPHPYLMAEPTAAAVVDLLTAARVWRQGVGIRGNGQLFLIGYSEGGYATMAAHRAIQADPSSPHNATLVGSASGAGPYDVVVTLDGLLARARAESRFLAAFVSPGLLRYLGATIRKELRRVLLRLMIPGDSDIVFQTTFIDLYLADDTGTIARESNVDDWAPRTPVRLFHGRDDQTVPYASSVRAEQLMRTRGAANLVLTDCTVAPADHLNCVQPYLNYMMGQIAQVIRDL